MNNYNITSLDKQVDKSYPSTVPKIPFSFYVCASKGGGKTTLILNLLKKETFYKNKFHKIYWISPTFSMDEKVNSIQNDNLTIANKSLYLAQKKSKKNTQILTEKNVVKNPELKAEPVVFFENLDLEWLENLYEHQKSIITEFGKKMADNILVILDDSISEKKIKSSFFLKFLLTSRHVNISTIFVSQSYMLLPRSIRINNSFISIFDIANKDVLKQIYIENSAGLGFKDWLELYEFCVKEDYGFLSISSQNDNQHRLIFKFTDFLMVEEF